MFRLTVSTLSILALTAVAAQANATQDRMVQYVKQTVVPWLSDPLVQSSILADNAKHAGLSEADIIALDKKWRAEVGHSNAPTIDAVMKAPISDMLRKQEKASGGQIVEIFVMDDRGLNVGASDVTSDYWQGDEAKWQKTYAVGPDAIDIGDVSFDELSQTYEAQVSIPVNDPATGKPIGAVTVGLNAEAF